MEYRIEHSLGEGRSLSRLLTVMGSPLARSTDVEQTLAAPAAQAPTDADAAFDAPYRSSRDDVYAYVAGLLRNRAAAPRM